MDERRGARAGGHRGIRTGDQQGSRTLGDSSLAAEERRAVLPGSGPGGARWLARRLYFAVAEKGSWTARLFHRADWRSHRAGAVMAALSRGGTLCAVDGVPAAPCVQALRRATQVGTLRHVRHLRGYAGMVGSAGNTVSGAAREGSSDATRQAG